MCNSCELDCGAHCYNDNCGANCVGTNGTGCVNCKTFCTSQNSGSCNNGCSVVCDSSCGGGCGSTTTLTRYIRTTNIYASSPTSI